MVTVSCDEPRSVGGSDAAQSPVELMLTSFATCQAITYVVDDSGTVRVEWPFGFESEHMTTDLTALLTRPEIR